MRSLTANRCQVALDRLAFSSALRDDGRLYGRAGVSGGYADYVFQQAAQARTHSCPVTLSIATKTLLIANLIPKAIRQCSTTNGQHNATQCNAPCTALTL